MTLLVTGFGAFPGVAHNPTAGLARGLDGTMLGGHRVVGRVLPVSYQRGPDEAIATARDIGADAVIGLGVASRRTHVCVERTAVRVDVGRPDVDGATQTGLVGPERVLATLDVGQLAARLGATVSDDAGEYVCNAWLYRVTTALDVPVAFVHVPPSGLAPDVLRAALQAVLAASS